MIDNISNITTPVMKVVNNPTPPEAGGEKNMPVQNDKTVDIEKPSQEQVLDAMSKMQDFVQTISRDINFSLDEESGEMVVKVIDSETKEVIRQMPSEEVLRVVRALENGTNFLLKTEA